MLATTHLHQKGRLELIIGPMFSGKSTELIARIRKHKIIKSRILSISHCLDMRYGDSQKIVSHNLEREDCVSVPSLMPLCQTEAYSSASVVFVEEGQFFPDLRAFCIEAVEGAGKCVVVSGLDGDFKRAAFGQILELIPLADRVDKLSALCRECGDGTPAIFSKRLVVDSDQQIAVGGLETYQPVCRSHYLH